MNRPRDIGHGPHCVACQHPEQVGQLLAEHRAALDRYAARARLYRQLGEAFRERTLTTRATDPRWPRFQELMLRFLGDANAIASRVMSDRAHLDRVEAAHTPEPTTEPR
ncbi:hypothetical protein [Thermomonospora amylolytica]|uniref:hypothetical protein n=1 Tax=Thermomonospora amylolytica TaxID=1411117 RepID=UPI000E6CCF7E|nr:hypothetical protein [Thermomonospora amylolytica]